MNGQEAVCIWMTPSAYRSWGGTCSLNTAVHELIVTVVRGTRDATINKNDGRATDVQDAACLRKMAGCCGFGVVCQTSCCNGESTRPLARLDPSRSYAQTSTTLHVKIYSSRGRTFTFLHAYILYYPFSKCSFRGSINTNYFEKHKTADLRNSCNKIGPWSGFYQVIKNVLTSTEQRICWSLLRTIEAILKPQNQRPQSKRISIPSKNEVPEGDNTLLFLLHMKFQREMMHCCSFWTSNSRGRLKQCYPCPQYHLASGVLQTQHVAFLLCNAPLSLLLWQQSWGKLCASPLGIYHIIHTPITSCRSSVDNRIFWGHTALLFFLDMQFQRR